MVLLGESPWSSVKIKRTFGVVGTVARFPKKGRCANTFKMKRGIPYMLSVEEGERDRERGGDIERDRGRERAREVGYQQERRKRRDGWRLPLPPHAVPRALIQYLTCRMTSSLLLAAHYGIARWDYKGSGDVAESTRQLFYVPLGSAISFIIAGDG